MKLNANALSDWLVTHGTNQSSLGALIRLYSHILRDAGIQVDRAFMGTLMIHPQAAAYAYFYEVSSDALRALEISHEDYQIIEAKQGTPMSHMLKTGTPLRARLGHGEDHGMIDPDATHERRLHGLFRLTHSYWRLRESWNGLGDSKTVRIFGRGHQRVVAITCDF